MNTCFCPTYWALDLFAGVMIVLLLAGVALTPATWHQPLELAWAVTLAAGVIYWQVSNGVAELFYAARSNMRWHNSPEQQRFDAIYGAGEEDRR